MEAILTILAADILAFLYACLIARKDASAIFAINHLKASDDKPTNNALKIDVSNSLHFTNKFVIVMFCSIIGTAAFFILHNYYLAAIVFAASGLVYWTWFDMSMGKRTKNDYWYLGSYSKTENAIGKGNGKKKAMFCAGAIIALHVTYFLIR